MTREVVKMSDGAASFVQGVAEAGAEVVREQLSVDPLQSYTLLIEALARGVFSASPRGLVAYLRAHADMAEAAISGDLAAKGAAVERLKHAIGMMMDDAAQVAEARGRRVS